MSGNPVATASRLTAPANTSLPSGCFRARGKHDPECRYDPAKYCVGERQLAGAIWSCLGRAKVRLASMALLASPPVKASPKKCSRRVLMTSPQQHSPAGVALAQLAES